MSKKLLKECENCGGPLAAKLVVEHEGTRDNTGELLLNEEGTAAEPFVVEPKGDVVVCQDCGKANPKYEADSEAAQEPEPAPAA